MKKKVLMGLVLLAVIGASAVFAQQPTLDKLTFTKPTSDGAVYEAQAANKNISGAVVIPDTYDGKPVINIGNFANCPGITSVIIPNSVRSIEPNAFRTCTGITSVTIPASVTKVWSGAFAECAKLTSVTFQGSNAEVYSGAFDGGANMGNTYKAGGAGTYTRPAGGNNWTKQGGGFTLNGVWKRSDGMEITISENGQNITITGNKPNNGGRLNDTYAKR